MCIESTQTISNNLLSYKSSIIPQTMVSPLSARLLANSGDSCSNGSSRGGGNSVKRSFSSQIHNSSASGYAADREEPSTAPPMNSIDLFSVSRTNNPREANNCPKRRKRNEDEFAATSVKADLARGGIDFRKIDQDKKETTCFGDVKINLKGVRLMSSKKFDTHTPLVTSNVSAQSSVMDYEDLARSCWNSYPAVEATRPSLETRMRNASVSQVFSSSTDQEEVSSDQSTSSVSDTTSENGSVESGRNSKGSNKTTSSSSNKVLFLPPNVDDDLKPDKQPQRITLEEGRPCNIIVSPSNSVTLNQVLQLTKTARLVTKASAPFSIIHANAASARLCGTSPEKSLGKPFSMMEANLNHEGEATNLQDCLISSSTGNYQKISIQSELTDESTECLIKVSPVVARQSETNEVMAVKYFSVELFLDDDNSSIRSTSPVSAQARAVGVMG